MIRIVFTVGIIVAMFHCDSLIGMLILGIVAVIVITGISSR